MSSTKSEEMAEPPDEGGKKSFHDEEDLLRFMKKRAEGDLHRYVCQLEKALDLQRKRARAVRARHPSQYRVKKTALRKQTRKKVKINEASAAENTTDNAGKKKEENDGSGKSARSRSRSAESAQSDRCGSRRRRRRKRCCCKSRRRRRRGSCRRKRRRRRSCGKKKRQRSCGRRSRHRRSRSRRRRCH